MKVDLFGLTMEAPAVTFYLWSPWRCSALEHKLFESLRGIPGATLEAAADEIRMVITEPKAWKAAVLNLSRVLKGWQEEGSDVGKVSHAVDDRPRHVEVHGKPWCQSATGN